MEVSIRTHSEAAARNCKRKNLKMKVTLKCLMEHNHGILFLLKALNPLSFGRWILMRRKAALYMSSQASFSLDTQQNSSMGLIERLNSKQNQIDLLQESSRLLPSLNTVDVSLTPVPSLKKTDYQEIQLSRTSSSSLSNGMSQVAEYTRILCHLHYQSYA